MATINNTAAVWEDVDQLDIYQNLTSCARPCVRDVNKRIIVGNTHCQTYGCVCAENTNGLHFVYGLSNVTECAKNACPMEDDVKAAEMAFQDICLVYAAGTSRPNKTEGTNVTLITAEGYDNLTACAKFALNGCLNENGVRDEANCGPAHEWENWERYRGVAEQRQCKTSECICKQPKFDASFAVAFDAGESYCGMYLSTEARPNIEYEKMQNVLATYCASEGYVPKEWVMVLTGLARASNDTNLDSAPRGNITNPDNGKR
ncbi:hypothetical protein BKA66DRAFT_549462 [Pyrenochaeta sp. MPI-SDFR-AT-0127]|nr:hypothetical protein BKA66DRAFT_549462 [Pyrenochaeta sp. MPI-SDFR-AT-0127]